MNKVLISFFCFMLLQSMLFQHNGNAQEDYQHIEQQYIKKFEAIEQEAISLLEELVKEASIEYKIKKKKEENTLPLLFKYVQRGRKLEHGIDKKFKLLLDELKHDLRKENLSMDLANKFEQHYLQTKKENIAQIYRLIQ